MNARIATVFAARRGRFGVARLCRRAQRREGAGRVRHQRRPARPLARSDLPLGKGRRDRPDLRRGVQRPRHRVRARRPARQRRARRTKRRSRSSRTTPRFSRTTSSSRKSMTARSAGKEKARRLAARSARGRGRRGRDGVRTELLTKFPIETPIQPKLDVSAFQRVLVAGFVAGGTEDVDANQETVRLLRSQLRTKSSLKVIDADIMPLMDIAQDPDQVGRPPRSGPARPAGRQARERRNGNRRQPMPLRSASRTRRTSSRTSGCSPTPPTGSGSARNTRTRSSSPARCSVHAALHVRLRPARAGNDRPVRPPPRRARPHLHGAEGLHPAAEVRLHRRPHRRDGVFGIAPRRDSLQRPAEHARPVVLFRADGPASSRIS